MTLPAQRKRRHGPDSSQTPGDGEASSKVKVVVRIRPPNVKEVEGNFREVVQAVDENVLVFDPKESCDYGGGRRRPRDIRKRPNRDLKFAFDHVFGPSASNKDLYNETTSNVLTGLFNGYNCSVFAYGATGAGKTHTMLGSKDQPGVMYHTMMDLYNRIEDMKDTKTCHVAVSYLEVYNETIRDLLMPGGTGGALPIREDPGQGVVIPGLSLHKPKTADELLYMLQFGNQHRTQHPTDANAESSRSHAVFQVFVRQKDRTANISTEVRVAKLCLVDLAGSERATVTRNKGSRFREGANINRSLLALGNVINALAENKNKGYVPYRDSKLTRLLKDSLGGNCQTVMIAAVSPSAMSFEDTYNTLRYANRAKNIKAMLKKNVLSVDFHMAKYGQIVEELRKEIKELKGKLQQYEDGKSVPSRQPVVMVDTVDFTGQQNELRRIYLGHQTLVCEQLQSEISLRNLQWKMFRKTRCLSRLAVVNEPAHLENVRKFESILNNMKQKSSCMEISSESSRSKVVDSFKHLGDIELKARSHADVKNGHKVPEVLSLSVQVHKLETDLQNTKLHLSYTKQVIRCQERELQHNERVLHQALLLLKKQHYIIKGHNMLTSDLQQEYAGIQARVAGQEVTWGDETDGCKYIKDYTLAEMLDLPTLGVKHEAMDTDSTCTGSKGEKTKNNEVFQFSAPPSSTQSSQSYPYKAVDECSPPKAKRALMSQASQQAPARVSRTSHKATPNKNRPGRSRSHSEHSSQRDRSTNSNNYTHKSSDYNNERRDKSLNRRNFHRSASSVNLSLMCNEDEDDESPDVVSRSKFSRINDTITKCKKFSNLHVKASSVPETVKKQGKENLDDTFTIDPSANPIPPSAIPHVDDQGNVVDRTCSKCDNSVNKLSVIKASSDLCVKCAVHNMPVPVSDSRTMVCNTKCSGGSEGNKGVLESHKSHKTMEQVESSHTAVEQVEPAQNYSYCVEDVQTGLSAGYGENDSGASTLVDQSANSVTSLASVSTLIDGSQNSSQNLSGLDEREQVHILNSCQQISNNFTSDGGNKSQQREGIKPANISVTVTKSKPITVDTDTVMTKGVVKAMRSIKFDNIENSLTPNKGKSYADIVRTPTPERQPLRQVGNCNTPLSTPRTDSGRSSLASSDNDSFVKSYSGDKMAGSRLFEDESSKENQFGMPSLAAKSLMNRSHKADLRKTQTGTPSYMQATKSHAIRMKHNTSKSSSSLNSSDDALGPKFASNKMKSSFISRNARPLAAHMRSKSTSNLSTRPTWQT